MPAPAWRAQSGPVPCSGAKRRGKVLDVVSAAIPGDAVAGNVEFTGRRFLPVRVERVVMLYLVDEILDQHMCTC